MLRDDTVRKAIATNLLQTVFAAWVRDLDLSVESIHADSATLRMRFSHRLCCDNGVVCGQALMSLADTAMVLA
jgi:acyl-coenzyme A thioesterase PaaI-like protein